MPLQLPSANVGFANRIRALCERLISTHYELGLVGRAVRDLWLPQIAAESASPGSTGISLSNFRGFGYTAAQFQQVVLGTWPLFNLLDEATPEVIAFVEGTSGMNAVTTAVDLVKTSLEWQDRVGSTRQPNALNQGVSNVLNAIADNANACRRVELEWRSRFKAVVEALPSAADIAASNEPQFEGTPLAEGANVYDGVTREQWLATMNSLKSYANFCFGYTAKLDDNDLTTKGYGHGDILAAF